MSRVKTLPAIVADKNLHQFEAIVVSSKDENSAQLFLVFTPDLAEMLGSGRKSMKDLVEVGTLPS